MRVRMSTKEQLNCFQTSCWEHAGSGVQTIPNTWNRTSCFSGTLGKSARMLVSISCSQLSQSAVVILFGTDYTQSVDGKSFLQSNLTAQRLPWTGLAPASTMCCSQHQEGCSGVCPIHIPALPLTNPVLWYRNCGITSATFPTLTRSSC